MLRADAGHSSWVSAAVSANGSQIVGESYNAPGFVTSPDGGSSWVQRNRTGTGVIISNDGRKLLTLNIGGNQSVLMSMDTGDSWKTILTPHAQISGERRTLAGIAASSDMSWIAVQMRVRPPNARALYVIYTSLDGGATWSEPTNLPTEGRADYSEHHSWVMASSSSGSRLVIARPGSPIYTSDDWGQNWVERVTTGSREWMSLTTSPDGQRVVAGEWDGWIHVSEDGGVTWVRRTSGGQRVWQAVACSNDGMLIACGGHGDYIYFSRDFGITWERQDVAGSQLHWSALALSEDGVHIVATGVGLQDSMGSLYTYTFAS